jgi:hypothetical protein
VSRAPSPVPAPAAGPAPERTTQQPAASTGGNGSPLTREELTREELTLDQLQEAWSRSVLPAVRERSIPIATLLGGARPSALEGDTLTIEFPASAGFHRRQAEEERNLDVLREALHEVTGQRLAVQMIVGAVEAPAADDDEPLSEEDVLTLLKDTFDATEVEGR